MRICVNYFGRVKMEKFNEELSCNIKPEDQTSQIIFCSGPNEWVMKVNIVKLQNLSMCVMNAFLYVFLMKK